MHSVLLLLLLVPLCVCQSQTLLNHLFAGYQAWFTHPQDSSRNGYTHYKMRSSQPFSRTNCVIDYWPDIADYPQNTKYPVLEFGPQVYLFSAYDLQTVMVHFEWMRQYGIDGAFLQRFGSDIRNVGSDMWKFKNKVLENVMQAAREKGRLWSLMYDLSGLGLGDIENVIKKDYVFLRDKYRFAEGAQYVRHRGRPLITVWGIGFNDARKYTLEQCMSLVQYLKNEGFSVMLGVPRYWREGGKDAVIGDQLALLHEIITKADVISPWTVGRYSTVSLARIDAQINVKQDLAWCNKNKLTLMPVIFPGFSWHNLQVSGENPEHPAPFDQIPRKQNGTYFLEAQGTEVVKMGAKTIYVAMFDEMNEGTAIFKCSRNPPRLEDGLKFLPYEESTDFYLKLTGKIGSMLKSK